MLLGKLPVIEAVPIIETADKLIHDIEMHGGDVLREAVLSRLLQLELEGPDGVICNCLRLQGRVVQIAAAAASFDQSWAN